jgi:hypothetical protein
MGVADGIYMWREMGIDAGRMSRELMAQCKAMIEADNVDIFKGTACFQAVPRENSLEVACNCGDRCAVGRAEQPGMRVCNLHVCLYMLLLIALAEGNCDAAPHFRGTASPTLLPCSTRHISGPCPVLRHTGVHYCVPPGSGYHDRGTALCQHRGLWVHRVRAETGEQVVSSVFRQAAAYRQVGTRVVVVVSIQWCFTSVH